MSNAIQKAIKNKRYIFELQPIVSSSGVVSKYESLVRLHVEEKKRYLLPADFFAEVEKKGAFGDILFASLENAFYFLKKNTQAKVTVNISYADIDNDVLVEKVLLLIEKEDLRILNRLIFEFTESHEVENINKVLSFCMELKKYGIKIAIDDFGTKNSNFYILSLVKVDYLKLDGHFIKNMNYQKTLMIIQAIISLCKKLEIEIIAEHIESANDYKKLSKIGVDFFQGYYFEGSKFTNKQEYSV